MALFFFFIGGEGLVRGSVAIAARLGISKLLIGLVIVGVRDVNAGTARVGERCSGGAPEIAYRNVIGSNIANVLLVVGLAAVIAPIIGWERTAVREAPVATLVSLAALALLQGDVIAHIGGIAMLVALAGYLFSSYWLKRRDRAA